MGSSASCFARRGGDPAQEQRDEAAAVAAIADAAAMGAREALMNAVRGAQAGAGAGGPAAEAAAHGAPPAARVAGVLPLAEAQLAAAEGARSSIQAMARRLRPAASRFACASQRFVADLHKVESAAAAGAVAGVKGVALMAALAAPAAGAQAPAAAALVAAAAATGARAGCFSVSALVAAGSNASKYLLLLGPMFWGSLLACAAAYHLLNASTDLIKLFVYGGFTPGIFIVSSGLIAGVLGTSPVSVRYCRLATIMAFVILWALITFALCSMFSSTQYQGFCGGIGGGLALIFVSIWLWYGW